MPPVIKAVRQILDAGLVGRDVQLVTLQTFRNTHAKGVDDWRKDWRRENRFSGGGIAMDHGSHTFYLAFDWLATYPTTITAKMSTLGDFDTEDNFACAMTFPNGTATAHLSWTAGVRKVIYTIHGDKGAVRVEDDDVEVAVMNGDAHEGHVMWEMKKQRIASEWMDASHVGWFRSLFDQFAEAIRTDDFVSHETESSVRCVELITTAYDSARDGSRERALSRGKDVIDLACSLLLFGSTLVVAVAYGSRVSRVGAARHARLDRAGSSPFLGRAATEMGYWAMAPASRACIALGITANAVSWTSLALGILAGVALGVGHFGLAAALSIVSSACDALDGRIARDTGTASDSGEVLDAAIDRYAELFFLGGIAFHERNDPAAVLLALGAITGAIMVSYSTAKAEALHVTPPRGAMRRQERAVYLVLGVALVPLAAAVCARWALPGWAQRAPLFAALALVAVVGNASAVRRLQAIAHAVRKPQPVRPHATRGGEALARDAHATAGDALR